jgi:hypothetical protein
MLSARAATDWVFTVPATPITEPVPEVSTVLAVDVNFTTLVLELPVTVQVPSTVPVLETVILVPTG